MKFCFLSTQAFSMPTLQALVRGGRHQITVCSLTPQQAAAAQVAGFDDYAPLCARLGVALHHPERFDLGAKADTAFFDHQRFDAILALGWNRLLPRSVLECTRYGAIGSHSSPHDLPFGRGRSPVVWAVALGFARITSQLFRIDSGVDTGAVLARRVLPIGAQDSSQILYYKIAMSHAAMIEDALAALRDGRHLPPSSLPDLEFPKRGPADAVIDWTQPAARLHDLVRAVAPPFHGAFFRHGGTDHRLLEARIWDGPPVTGACGEVIAVFSDRAMIVTTGQGALLCLTHDCHSARAGDILE